MLLCFVTCENDLTVFQFHKTMSSLYQTYVFYFPALLFSLLLFFLLGTVYVPPPMFWGIQSELASLSSCLDTSSAAEMWRWETQFWRRKRGRNLTSSSPRIVILKMINVLTVNQTCSSTLNICHICQHTQTCSSFWE